MATDPASSLIAQFPDHTIHLTDTSGFPILSSVISDSPSSDASEATLTSLTSVFLQAQETASRLGLGMPKRITVETEGGGVVVVQSSITASPSLSPSPSAGDPSSPTSGGDSSNPNPASQLGDGDAASPRVPTLISTVIAPSATQMAEARLATWSVEAIGRKFQKAWLAEQEEQGQSGDLREEEELNGN